MRRLITAMAFLATAAPAGRALAHHAYVMFDVSREVMLHGVVKDVQWTSPHVRVDMIVREPSGKAELWPIEGASPGLLSRFGWTSSSLAPGEQVDLTIHPRRDGGQGGSLITAVVNGQAIGGPRS